MSSVHRLFVNTLPSINMYE